MTAVAQPRERAFSERGPIARSYRRFLGKSMLLMFALVPQTSGAVGALPLLLVPRSFRAVTVLAILTYVPIFYAPQAGQTIEQWSYRETFATLFAVYLPVLWIVLRMPNHGPVPAWLETLASRLPAWIRGTQGPAADPVSMDQQPVFRSRSQATR